MKEFFVFVFTLVGMISTAGISLWALLTFLDWLDTRAYEKRNRQYDEECFRDDTKERLEVIDKKLERVENILRGEDARPQADLTT